MSRVPPKMEQLAAIKANVYHVLPVAEKGLTFSIDIVFTENPRTSEHFLVATNFENRVTWRSSIYRHVYDETLEGDVQDIFVVDLRIERDDVVVKLEYHGTFRFNKETGKKI